MHYSSLHHRLPIRQENGDDDDDVDEDYPNLVVNDSDHKVAAEDSMPCQINTVEVETTVRDEDDEALSNNSCPINQVEVTTTPNESDLKTDTATSAVKSGPIELQPVPVLAVTAAAVAAAASLPANACSSELVQQQLLNAIISRFQVGNNSNTTVKTEENTNGDSVNVSVQQQMLQPLNLNPNGAQIMQVNKKILYSAGN